MKKLFTLTILSLLAFMVSAQTVTGVIYDDSSEEPLIGASVLIKGTSVGTITDIDGSFSLDLSSATDPVLVVSFLGFATQELDLSGRSGDINLGAVNLTSDGLAMDEIVVLGTVDIADDRTTPVAVSTIRAIDIQRKSGNTEFPDVLKNTPSVYVSNQIGGFGDSQIFTRGFGQTNTAFLLNGQPINGMEDGRMYWSNWSGMNDIANAVQIQRGLGSSKLAISSVGGTVNIITKATEQQQGGWAGLTVGNNAYVKGTVAYNTGLINDKFGVSALVTHWQGNGYAEGTKGQGQNYFFSVGYKPNANHNLNFLITGAPQWHDQAFALRISQYEQEDGSINRRFNTNIGTLNGEYLTERRNYYHKPVANFNWAWKINDNSNLSTVAYASWGRGGGTGNVGRRIRTDEGYVDWDAIQAANEASADGSATYAIRASANNHQWYGAVSTYDIDLTPNINFSVGADVRNYTGLHFRQIINLLGADHFLDTRNERFPNNQISATFKADPWAALTNYADVGERYAWDYNERITYGGLFGQLEYAAEAFSGYVQGSISSQSHVRWDRYQYTEANEQSEVVTNPGFNIKGGANYNIDNNNGVFFNVGFYSRQPFHDNLYLNFGNDVNLVAQNEDIFGLEVGYRYRSARFDANVNAYRTSWAGRVETRSIFPGDTINNIAFPMGGFSNLSNLAQLHQGVEIDMKYRVSRIFAIKAFGSLGDWAYVGTTRADLYDDERNLLDSEDALEIDGIRVGNSAQTSFGLGLTYNPTSSFDVYADFNYYDRLYGNSSPFSADEAIELPSYGLLDLGLGYKFFLSNGQILRLRANIYNLTNVEYISYSRSNIPASDVESENYKGVNKSNSVAFGTGTTWNVSARYSF